MIIEQSGISKKQKQSKLFGFLIGLGVFLIAIAIMSVIRVTPYSVYKDPATGVQVKYPSYWEMLNRPDGGAVVAFRSPPQTALDTYAENVNIVFQDLSAKPMALPQYSQLAIRQFTGTFKTGTEIVESAPTRLANRPAYRFTYIVDIPEASAIKLTHVWVVDGVRAYIFTYSATEADYDAYLGEVNTMLKSFTIL